MPSPRARPSRLWALVWVPGGALVGAGLGALIGYGAYEPDPSSIDFGPGVNAAIGAVIGVLIGVCGGAVVFWAWRRS